MRVKILSHVNSHWRDGRHFSAMDGAVADVDDDDTEMVAHMQYLVDTGQAELIMDEPKKAIQTAEEPKKTTPVEAKKARTTTRGDQ